MAPPLIRSATHGMRSTLALLRNELPSRKRLWATYPPVHAAEQMSAKWRRARCHAAVGRPGRIVDLHAEVLGKIVTDPQGRSEVAKNLHVANLSAGVRYEINIARRSFVD